MSATIRAMMGEACSPALDDGLRLQVREYGTGAAPGLPVVVAAPTSWTVDDSGVPCRYWP